MREVTLSWCDKLASTPVVGFTLDAHLVPSDLILQSLTPLISQWAHGETLDFSVDNLDIFGLTFTTNTGFRYGFTQSKISIEFVHRLKMRPTSGGPPVAELTSTPLPYSTLMTEIVDRLIAVALLLPESRTRKINRVGVVTTTSLDEEMMPPGILRFIKYIGRPWGGSAEEYNIQILSEVAKGNGFTDRCSHIVVKTDSPDQLPVIKFDWQRSFDLGRAIHRDIMTEILRDATKAAMDYFEDLAEGNRFDE